MKKISHDRLRELLREGFEEFMTMIPTGDAEALNVEFTALEQAPVNLVDGSRIDLLVDFIRFISAFHRYPSEKVCEIIANEGGARAILLGDTGPLVQQYLD